MSVIVEPDAVTDEQPLQSFRGYIATSPLELARAAREFMHTYGSVPFGFLRTEIEQSWRRSLVAGVPSHAPVPCAGGEVLDAQDVLQQNELLVRTAQPELDSLARHFGSQALIILCSADACILEVRGGDKVRTPELEANLRPGVIWQEGLLGTNALGTAIIERNTVHIRPGEHYLESLARFSCTSSPVFGASGELMGVLDLTRLGQHVQPMDVTGLLNFAVRSIENRLFMRHFGQHMVIAFHSRQHYLRSAWQGLLALDDNGRIAGVNLPGCELLGRERESLLGLLPENLFQCPLPSLFADTLHGIAHRRTPAGKLYFEMLRAAPLLSHSAAATAVAERPAPAEPCPLVSVPGSRLERAFTMALRAVERNIPVLLHGETGTGKEVAARSLHQAGSRGQKPFVAVNCAAIPETLMESELFGYRDGAFTGARKGGMPGRFQQASGGTLFLDEIGDMPLALQARLLRVLQERKVQPLGGGDEVSLDIQLLAATHHDLKKMVAEGRFREDLYYRLNGVSITMPPLRERPDFLPLLQDLIRRSERPQVTLDSTLLKKLRSYHWPGNVRQLQMVLQVALAFMDEHETLLTEAHLSDDFLQELEQEPAPRSGLLQENEASLIRRTLDDHDGNVSAAAAALGISRATLYRRLRDL